MYFRTRNAVKLNVRSMCKVIKRDLSRKDSVNVHYLGGLSLVDFESELMNIPAIEKIYSDRHREPNVDLHVLRDLHTLLKKQTSINTAIRKLLQTYETENGENNGKKVFDVEQMTASDFKHYYTLKQKDVFDQYYQLLRNQILHFCFLLPNKLNVDTPRGDEDLILHPRVSEKTEGHNHVEIGHKLNVLVYENCASYFLVNEAAIFEMALQRYLRDILRKELKFKPFLNPDTCHDFLCVGVQGEAADDYGFLLQDSPYRLNGSASLAAFCAYRTRQSAHNKYMPERFFTCGRRYILPPDDVPDDGLYSVAERTNVHLIVFSASVSDMQSEFDNTLRWLISLYERLDLDFRVCYKRASALQLSESLRASIQLYSSQNQDYVEVACLSMYDDFISRRLRILWHDKNRNAGFVWIIDGVVVSVPVILAHLLERSKDKLIIPDCIRPYMYTTETLAAYK